MKESVSLLFSEALQLIKSTIGIVVLVGGGLVPGLLFAKKIIGSTDLIYVSLACVILFLLVLILRVANHIDNISWYDKRYEKLHQCWRYTLSEDKKTFTGECISERKVTSLCNSTSFITISIDKDQVLIPFQLEGKNNVELLESYRDQGAVVLNQAHKTNDSKFSFRVYFNPPLSKGEIAYFKVKYIIDNFKISNLEDLRNYMTKSKIETRDYEYNSFRINYPTKDFKYEVVMPLSCKAIFSDLSVQRGTSNSTFEKERDYVVKKKHFMVISESDGWRMKLERKNPPIKTRYMFSWNPANNRNVFEG